MRLRGASPQGRICSACVARRRHGRCACCDRDATLVGRGGDGRPWCSRCHTAAAAARLAGRRRASIVAAVATCESALDEATVLAVIEQVAGVRRLGQLAGHLQAHPDTLTTGPTSLPPVLDRFVRALVAAGATTITVIHPTCLDCGRSRPAQQRLTEGVLCAACYARVTVRRCVGCDRLRRPYARDEAGNPRCTGCVTRQRRHVQRADQLHQLMSVLGEQASLDDAAITGVLATAAARRGDLRVLTELLVTHRLSDPVLPFALSRLVIALRAAGADLPEPACQTCGQPSGPAASLHLGQVRCRACAQHCPQCGTARRLERERICWRCRGDRHRRRGSCGVCQQPGRLIDDQGWCRWCRNRAARTCADCDHHATALTVVGERQVCQPCALHSTLDAVLSDQPPGALHALRTPILAADPQPTRNWLQRPAITALLTDLDTGRVPLTHATLDAQPPSRGIEHLRDLLLAVGALTQDPERPFERLLHDSHQLLSAIPVSDTRIVHSWLRWQVLPRLRGHHGGPVDIVAAAANAKHTLRQVAAFLATLQVAGHTLAECHQHDLDQWFRSRQASRHRIRPFLAWAQRTRHLPAALTLPQPYQAPRQSNADPEQRWRIARRLVHDATLDTVDRVAGALVVLYAQPLVRVCALTTGDVATNGQNVTVRLGASQLRLAEPFATLIQSLPLHRRAGIAEQLPGSWLFPGHRAGRHLAATALGHRLRAIGIEPRTMRLAALDQLSKEMPPAMLAGILGLTAQQTVRHTAQAGGDWAQYAADRAT